MTEVRLTPSRSAILRLLIPSFRRTRISPTNIAAVFGRPMGLAFLPGLGNPGPHPVAEDVPLELGEDGQHACQGPTTGCRQVEGFVEGDESHVDRGQIVQGRDEVRDRTAPTVEPPDDDGI